MADNAFIKLLEQLVKIKDLDLETTNEMIGDAFPDAEERKNMFRPLVMERMDVLKVHNIQKILKLLNKVYPKLFKNTTTLDNYFSNDIRRPLAKRFGENSTEHKLSKKLARLDYEVKGEILKAAKAKVFEKNSNRTEYSTEQILTIIRENIVSDDPMKRAVALLAASGARPIELFEKANFIPFAYENSNSWVEQDFVAKKKGAVVSVVKPILYLTNQKFIDELKSMRDELHERYPTFLGKNGQLLASISQRLNKVSKQIFEFEEDFTAYTSRKLYGLLSFDLYGRVPNLYGTNVSYQAWLSRVLGHKENDITTAANYSTFTLKPETVTPIDIASQQLVLTNKIEAIETRLDDLKICDETEKVEKIIVNNKRIDTKFASIKAIADTLGNVTQSSLEVAAKGTASRSIIRLFYKKFYKGK